MTHEHLDPRTREALFEYLLRLGDDCLVLGHRLSQWCGHGPILEEDVAMTNIALDKIGQAEALLSMAGELEGKGRSADDLAYFRDETEFRNLQLVERPNGHFGDTMVRQFLFDAYAHPLFTRLAGSAFAPLAGLAAKCVKEVAYHLRHASAWIVRLGDGTRESHDRVQSALDHLWEFTGELFFKNQVDEHLIALDMVPDPTDLTAVWQETVAATLATATLRPPPVPPFMAEGARLGRHSEHLGHMLAEMQILARSHPGARW